MPLIKSASEEAVGENIRREREAGKDEAQAIAIAKSQQRRMKGKHIGRAKKKRQKRVNRG